MKENKQSLLDARLFPEQIRAYWNQLAGERFVDSSDPKIPC